MKDEQQLDLIFCSLLQKKKLPKTPESKNQYKKIPFKNTFKDSPSEDNKQKNQINIHFFIV